MKSLPSDENNPLASAADVNDLILWLAYKEAKALIKLDLAPSPKGEKKSLKQNQEIQVFVAAGFQPEHEGYWRKTRATGVHVTVCNGPILVAEFVRIQAD